MNKLLLTFVWIVFLGLIGCPASSPESTQDQPEDKTATSEESTGVQEDSQTPGPERIESLTDFTNSDFFQKYNCLKRDTYELSNGNTNHPFYVDVHLLDVQTEPGNQKIVGMGFMFFERRILTDSDFAMITDLLTSLDQTSNHDATISFIKANVENSVSQIIQAESIDDGNFRIWAGKVGTEQTLSFERLN